MTSEIKENRIYFFGNPWPNGHRIQSFSWFGEINTDKGLLFHFDLNSAKYNEDDNNNFDLQDPDDATDWESRIVWRNYHSCTISSCNWETTGFLVGTKKEKFDFSKLEGKEFRVDALPFDFYETELVFSTYLLGHDSVADHKIKFLEQKSKGEFIITWKGKCALSYTGDDEFKYDFEALISPAKFEGIFLPKNMSKKKAILLLSDFVTNPNEFILTKEEKKLKFIFKE